MTDEEMRELRDLTNTELRRQNTVLREEIRELEAALTKSRQIISGHRNSPWAYLPHYTMDTVKDAAK